MLVRTSLALVWLSAMAALSNASCDLACPANAPCVEGKANFTDHPQPAGDEFDFHTTLSVNGQHCACPHYLTGVLCDVKFETCDGDHLCYNGGKCIPGLLDELGNEQLYCDCSSAVVDGVQYVGKWCEHEAENYCNDEETLFCLTGRCNVDYPQFGDPCICDDGFEGPNCQYTSGSVPECDLDCQNGGVCTLEPLTEEEKQSQYFFFDDQEAAHMRCDCPPEFGGRYCEMEKTTCGSDGEVCYHGGTCVERVVDGKTLHHCDCSNTYTEEVSYAGRTCLFPATSYCSKSGSGLNGHLFCVNGGKCRADPYMGCECVAPFTGFSCEYVDGGDGVGEPIYQTPDDDDGSYNSTYWDPPEVGTCDLTCKNGGVCRIGVKDQGALAELIQNAPLLNRSEDNFAHCSCPPGFFGLYCEEEVDVCGEGEHLCLYGSQCVSNEQGEHACDCSLTTSEVSSVFAGDSCQHPVNDICTESSYTDTTPLSFCVNGGSCKKRVTVEEEHPGCNCADGFEGPHCELRSNYLGSSNSSSSHSGGMLGFEVVVLVVSLVAIALVASFSVLACVRRRRNRKDDELTKSLKWAASGYRDDPSNDGPNIAPRRSSYIDDAYPVKAHSSSTDPFTTHLAPKSRLPVDEEVITGSPDVMDDPVPQPQVYIGPPRDEDGHELHNVEII